MGSNNHGADVLTFSLFEPVEVFKVKTVYEGANTNLQYDLSFKGVETNISYPNTDYSIVGFKLMLSRYYAQQILHYYFPTLIFVAVSWMSFIIPPEVIPGRMALLITVLLVLVDLYRTIIRTQPPSKSPTFLVIWMIACITFVTMTLLEYFLLLLRQRLNIWKNANKPLGEPCAKSWFQNGTPDIINQKMDKLSLLICPLLFLLFNFIYWPAVAAQHLAAINSYHSYE